ncbi:MAG: D-2-hydroxyacid dehydrogenase [Acholeplasmataceae bacterium]
MRIHVDRRFIPDSYVEQLKNSFPEVEFLAEERKTEAEALMVMPSFFKDVSLDRYPDLVWVQLLSAGYDGVPLEALFRRRILLTNAKDVYSIQIAEDVFAKILSFDRHVMTYYEQMKEGIWERHEVRCEIHGSTVGLIGAGSIPRAVAKRMKAFGAHTIGYKRTHADIPYFDRIVTDLSGLDEIYRTSDYLILAIPLNEKTRYMVDRSVLQRMKETALLVNVARGDIIRQDDLIEALDEGRIRGALLDVTSPEPLPKEHPLWYTDRVLITPHTAAESPYIFERIYQLVHRNLADYLNGRSLDSTVSD